MDDMIIIHGGKRLSGRLPISGAKNSALALMPCALLTDEPVTLLNLPRLVDVDHLGQLLNQLGVTTSVLNQRLCSQTGDFGHVMLLQAARVTSTVAPHDMVCRMRASVLVLGALLAREGQATVALPGGCAIGKRPIDLHLEVLQALGAKLDIVAGCVHAKAPDGGLPGGTYHFPVVSVGATENALMAASLANGTSVFTNAAREPEVVDLCRLLVAMGAEIAGIGSSELTVVGRRGRLLHGATYRIIADRIEAGSYACAAAITGGEVELVGADSSHMVATVGALRLAGVTVVDTEDGVLVRAHRPLTPLTLSTATYPGFATDMQAQFMALLCKAEGSSVLTETIFENRYMHVAELTRMGARVRLDGRTAVVDGVGRLTGARVTASDLRASMSLVIAALAAEGETRMAHVYHLDRGYERLVEKLQLIGANVQRVSGR